ncbi:hypothetical protein HXX76_012421 [Chlamydomonas incerta]|uniref:Heterokaryon incompatibility domain-containing protein n=1 Tax=Chlamydomonas incerta TaxID=51695 RepID=A0A835SPR4_CHLIN|nr:hypothetical protein HXX76_012421 [Chlamydomonas incerta]|eukprot:KAG2427488.1 hypothetical protein HXX76_012421 [Chlamydomonas incerta]
MGGGASRAREEELRKELEALQQARRKEAELAQLPAVIRDLHGGMPPEIAGPPMRLMRIAAVLGWSSGIMVYEDVDPADCEELPYADVSETQWAATCVLSWRWGAPKPGQRQPGFSPMAPAQFQQLVAVLGRMAGAGFQFVWIDWCCVPQYSAPSMVEVLRSKVFYARARAMLVVPTFHPLPAEGIVRPLLARTQQLLADQAAATAAAAAAAGAGAAQLQAIADNDAAAAAAAVGAILEGGSMGCREYLHRVWTLAERMARFGRGEPLSAWVSLEAWLGMLTDAVVAAAGVANGCGGGGGGGGAQGDSQAALLLYKRIMDARSAEAAGAAAPQVSGSDADGSAAATTDGSNGSSSSSSQGGALMDALVPLLASAAATGSLLGAGAAGLGERFAGLLRLGAAVWRRSRLEEAPSESWLRGYLADMQAGTYQAWSDADRIWAVYSYFCWKKVDPGALPEAIQDLVRVSGGGRDHLLAVGSRLGLGAQGVAAIAGAIGMKELQAAELERAKGMGRQLLDAAAAGELERVRALLADGASLQETAKGGVPPLSLAAANGHVQVLEVLLAAGVNKDEKDMDWYSPLSHAAEKGHVEVVKVLLAAGANIEARDRRGKSPLGLAAMGGHAQVVSVLLAAGADWKTRELDQYNTRRQSPLQVAAEMGHTAVLSVLLEAGGAVDIEDSRLALVTAASHGRTEVLLTLLAAGVDKEATDRMGATPLISAAMNGHTRMVSILLQAGADKEAKNIDGDTTLVAAARAGKDEVVQLLLEAGANKQSRGENGFTALMWAAKQGHEEMLADLLAAGASVNVKANDGCTPLMWAAQFNHLEVVRALLSAGADRGAKNKAGDRAEDLASGRGVLALLQQSPPAGKKAGNA